MGNKEKRIKDVEDQSLMLISNPRKIQDSILFNDKIKMLNKQSNVFSVQIKG